METKIQELTRKIYDTQVLLGTNMASALKGNKAAACRARKITLDLTKLYKEYRKESIAAIG